LVLITISWLTTMRAQRQLLAQMAQLPSRSLDVRPPSFAAAWRLLASSSNAIEAAAPEIAAELPGPCTQINSFSNTTLEQTSTLAKCSAHRTFSTSASPTALPAALQPAAVQSTELTCHLANGNQPTPLWPASAASSSLARMTNNSNSTTKCSCLGCKSWQGQRQRPPSVLGHSSGCVCSSAPGLVLHNSSRALSSRAGPGADGPGQSAGAGDGSSVSTSSSPQTGAQPLAQ
jgi:hypothetical protein